MSILIKGIDMPKKANHHFQLIFYSVDESQGIIWEGFLKDRVFEIPTPHGRLVDIDKVKDELKDQVPCCGLDRTYRVSNAFDTMNNAPTILEGEE